MVYCLWARGSENAKSIRRARIAAWASLVWCLGGIALFVVLSFRNGLPANTDLYVEPTLFLGFGVAVSATAVYIMRKGAFRGHEPRCDECGYLLTGLTRPRCPECGADFDPSLLRDLSADTKRDGNPQGEP